MRSNAGVKRREVRASALNELLGGRRPSELLIPGSRFFKECRVGIELLDNPVYELLRVAWRREVLCIAADDIFLYFKDSPNTDDVMAVNGSPAYEPRVHLFDDFLLPERMSGI